MHINETKSNSVYFRPGPTPRSEFELKCGLKSLQYANKYTYLRILLREHIEFNITAKHVAQSSSRAVCLLIAKCKLMGGVPYDVFSKL